MKSIYVIKINDSNIGVATNKKEVINIIKAYIKTYERPKEFELIDHEVTWNRIYRNICKQFKISYCANIELFIRKGPNEDDFTSIEIKEFEPNRLLLGLQVGGRIHGY